MTDFALGFTCGVFLTALVATAAGMLVSRWIGRQTDEPDASPHGDVPYFRAPGAGSLDR